MDKALIFYYLLGIALVLATSFSTYFLFTYYNLRLSTWVLCLFPICSVYMFFAQLLKYRSLHFYVDFSHWAKLLYSIAVTGKPWSMNVELLVPGTMNYLSVHFVPLIYILAMPFKVWPFAETIIVLNILLMISAAIPMYKLALTCQGDKRFALFMIVLLFWYPTFQYLVLYEFEMLRFSIPIILWMLYFWEKKKMACYYLFVLLAVLVREEVGLTIMMFGLYLLLIEKQRKTGLITALTGATAFIVITQIFMPALRDGTYQHIAMGSFSTLGNSIADIIKTIITNPIFALKTIFEPNSNLVVKFANLFMFFIPLLFIPLLAPALLIPILGNVGIGFLSGSLTHISYMLFYVSTIVPFILYAFIKGWPKFLKILPKAFRKKPSAKEGIDVSSGAMVTVLSGLLVTNIFFSPSPISLQFWSKDLRPAPFETQNHHYSAYIVTDHHRKVEEFVDMIPDSVIVAAPSFLAPRLFKKKGVVDLNQRESSIAKLDNTDNRHRVDYVLVDKASDNLDKWRFSYTTRKTFEYLEKNSANWKLAKADDGYFLYKRIAK